MAILLLFQFIDDRLVLLNSGKGFQDEFEIEMTRYTDDKNNGAKYKEWLASMKVGKVELSAYGLTTPQLFCAFLSIL